MKPLAQFNPRWIGRLRTPEHGEGLAFDCPTCGPSHTLVAYFDNPLDGGPAMPMPEDQKWHRIGDEMETLTVHPSLNYPCWHGWVAYGAVVHVSEGTPAQMQAPDGTVKPMSLSPFQVVQLLAHQGGADGR